ncbi:MAG: site-2 protease family protein [Candidatus Nezhaarchaeota archaeon]|nr:site-2 protease family protein [Candidatus Nezhaarchaeota archaeon]
MEQVVLWIAIFLSLWSLIAIIYKVLNLKKYGFLLKPFLLIARSKSLAKKLETVGSSKSRIWSYVSNLSLFVSGGLMFFAFYFLIISLINRIMTSQVGLYPVVPGVTIGWEAVPYFILAASITILVHETFHAITFGSEKVPTKSFGVFLIAILPGGFVEADEEAFKSSRPLSRMRIYASGSFSNFLVFLLGVLLTLATISPTPYGVLVLDTFEDSPAHRVLKSWDVILSINGHEVRGIRDLEEVLGSIKPGESVEVAVLRDREVMRFLITTAPHPRNVSRSYLGVMILPFDYHPPTIPWLSGEAYLHWILMLDWLKIVSLSVALINMLPIPLLDGSGFLRSLLESLLKDRKAVNVLMNFLGAFSLFLLLANIIPSIEIQLVP